VLPDVRRAKIVSTLGPATDNLESVRELVAAGVDVFRLNMSHGDHSDHARRLGFIRQTATEAGRTIGCFADLQGPKIRLDVFENGPHYLNEGDTFTITVRDIAGTATVCGTTLKTLPQDVHVGDSILLDDGKVALQAILVTEEDVVTRVTVGGYVSDHKGINLPGVAVSVPALSEKDKADLRWALKAGVDMVALSFVRSADDVDTVHRIMTEEGVRVPVIAKIEKPQALENLDDIIDAFDAFMVARGDLGVELPLEQVPIAQKRIISAARKWAKPVIVATQMLESMIDNPRPTRAEASDVANAILDGADAVMLSGETAVGKYPVVTVLTMGRIVEATEEAGVERIEHIQWDPHTAGGVIAKAAAEVAERVEAKFLVAFTQSGDTGRRLSRLRTKTPVLAFTPIEQVSRQLALSWGVQSHVIESYDTREKMERSVGERLTAVNQVKKGDRIVIVSGRPGPRSGQTNNLHILKM
jgi:pyruvate kinase